MNSNAKSESLNNIDDTLTSHILVCDNDTIAVEQVKDFCASKNLVGMLAQTSVIYTVLSSNIHLGAIFISEDLKEDDIHGIEMAIKIHKLRPELPIFIRREKGKSISDFPDELQKMFAGCYEVDKMDQLSELIDRYIFSSRYPNEMVRGIRELSTEIIKSSFKEMEVTCDHRI